MTIKGTRLIACGGYLPERALDNQYFAERLDTDNDWIVSRTGIQNRFIAAEGQNTSDLAAAALQDALKNSGIDPESLDGIIVATTTPDVVFPAVATMVQAKLGIKNQCFAFDMQAVCTGFVYALTVASSMIKGGAAKRIAVIGAETMSRVLDWQDRATVVLFGDGAGAFILEACEDESSGVQDSALHCEGSLGDILHVPGGTGVKNPDAALVMQGREVFKIAVSKGTEVVQELMKRNQLSVQDIDCFIFHQANARILDALSDKLGIPKSERDDKVLKSLHKHANTSAASIPLAFYHRFGHEIPAGKQMVLAGFGGGMTWGSLYLKT